MSNTEFLRSEAIRKEQAAFAQIIEDDQKNPVGSVRSTISVPNKAFTSSVRHDPAHVSRASTDRRAPVKLKGHEAFIKSLEGTGADVVLEKASSGHVYYGKFKHSDKWTITMLVTHINADACVGAGYNIDYATPVDPHERVIYKQDISEFYTTTARPERT